MWTDYYFLSTRLAWYYTDSAFRQAMLAVCFDSFWQGGPLEIILFLRKSRQVTEILAGKISSFCPLRLWLLTREPDRLLTVILSIGPWKKPKKEDKKRLQELSWGGRLSTQKADKVLRIWTKSQVTDRICTSANSNYCSQMHWREVTPLRHRLLPSSHSWQFLIFWSDQRQSKEE